MTIIISGIVSLCVLFGFFYLCARVKSILLLVDKLVNIMSLLGVKQGVLDYDFEPNLYKPDINTGDLKPQLSHSCTSAYKVHPTYPELGSLSEKETLYIDIYGINPYKSFKKWL